jgi:hypothetical protein
MRLKWIVFLLILLSNASCTARASLKKPLVYTRQPTTNTMATFIQPSGGWRYSSEVPHKSCGKYFFTTGKVLQVVDASKSGEYVRVYPVNIEDILVLLDDFYQDKPTIEDLYILGCFTFKVISIGSRDYQEARDCLPEPMKEKSG